MSHKQRLLIAVGSMILIYDISLAVHYVRLRGKMESVESRFRVELKERNKSAPSSEISNRANIARSYCWSGSDFFESPEMLLACDAILHNDETQLRKLLDAQLEVNTTGKYGFTLLFWAFACDNLQAFELLLEQGADPDRQLKRSIAAGRYEFLYLMDSVLFSSAKRNNERFLLSGLKYSHDINRRDITGENVLHVLTSPSSFGTFEVLNAAIAAGVDVNAADGSGSTPVRRALGMGRFAVALQLLKAGADPRVGVDGLDGFKKSLDVASLRCQQRKEVEGSQQLDEIAKWLMLHFDIESNSNRI